MLHLQQFASVGQAVRGGLFGVFVFRQNSLSGQESENALKVSNIDAPAYFMYQDVYLGQMSYEVDNIFHLSTIPSCTGVRLTRCPQQGSCSLCALARVRGYHV